MKKKLLLCLVALLGLGACQTNSSETLTPEEVLKEALTKPILIDQPSGTPILPGLSKRTFAEGHKLRVVEKLEIDSRVVTVEYAFTGEWLRVPEEGQLTMYKPVFVFGESWETLLNVTFKLGSLTATDSYEFTIAEGKVKLFSIKELQEGVNAYDPAHPELGGIKGGAGEEGDLVTVRGYLTSIHADLNTGIIQDGNYGAQLYRLDTPVGMFKGKIGDLLTVTGHVTPYNGCLQLGYITDVEVELPTSFPNIIAPTLRELTEAEFNAITIPFAVVSPGGDGYEEYLAHKAGDSAQHTLVKMNVKYVKGNFVKNGASGNITLTSHVTVTVKVGNTEFGIYLNYHNGVATMGEWAATLDGIKAGADLVIIGTISWSPTPVKTQILPWAPEGLVKA